MKSDKPFTEMLRKLVNYADEAEEDPRWASAMRDMLASGQTFFSVKQALYICEIYGKVFDEPQYTNDVSAGRVPVGEALRTTIPDVLRKPLPLKPPGRR